MLCHSKPHHAFCFNHSIQSLRLKETLMKSAFPYTVSSCIISFPPRKNLPTPLKTYQEILREIEFKEIEPQNTAEQLASESGHPLSCVYAQIGTYFIYRGAVVGSNTLIYFSSTANLIKREILPALFPSNPNRFHINRHIPILKIYIIR